MPGIGTAIGGIAGAFMDGMGGGSSSAPMDSQSAVYGSGLDGSGWAVNFQGVQSATSSPSTSTGQGWAQPISQSGFSLASVPSWFWLAAGGLLLWKKLHSPK